MRHPIIWLQAWCRMCDRSSYDGRLWSQDEFDKCESCGKKPTRYALDTQEEAHGTG